MKAPRKQRHTIRRLFEQLRDELCYTRERGGGRLTAGQGAATGTQAEPAMTLLRSLVGLKNNKPKSKPQRICKDSRRTTRREGSDGLSHRVYHGAAANVMAPGGTEGVVGKITGSSTG